MIGMLRLFGPLPSSDTNGAPSVWRSPTVALAASLTLAAESQRKISRARFRLAFAVVPSQAARIAWVAARSRYSTGFFAVFGGLTVFASSQHAPTRRSSPVA
jgi:hypothetical protein